MSLPISPHRMTSLDSSSPSLSGGISLSRKEQSSLVLISTPQNFDEEVEDITINNQHSKNISEDQQELTAETPISYNEDDEAVPLSTIKPLSLIEENNTSKTMVSFQEFLTLKKNQQNHSNDVSHSSSVVSPRTLAAVKRELDSSRIEILEPEELLDSHVNNSFRKQSNIMPETDFEEETEDVLIENGEDLITDSDSSDMYAVPYEASPDIPIGKTLEGRKSYNSSFVETLPYEIIIQYERQSKEFKPGETVKGYVKLKNAIKLEMSQAIITLLGKESLFYPQLSVEENVITQIETRFGRSIFNKGAHMLEFSFVLPDNMEPSIEKNFATIGYTINASVQCLLQNSYGDFEEQYLSCISSFTVHTKDIYNNESIVYTYGEEDSFQCTIELNRNVYIPEDVIKFTLDLKNCAMDLKSRDIIIKVVERTSYQSLLSDFKELDDNVIVFHTLNDCHTLEDVKKTIQVTLPSDISESTRGQTKMMNVSHLIEIDFGEGGISIPFYVVSSVEGGFSKSKNMEDDLSPINLHEDPFQPPTPLTIMKNILSTPSHHLFPNMSPIAMEKESSSLLQPTTKTPTVKTTTPQTISEKNNVNNSIAAMFSQYNPNSPTHQAYINYKIDYNNHPHDTIMITPYQTSEKKQNSTFLNESDIDGINKQIEKTKRHVDELNGMLKESSAPFTNDDFWWKYSPQIPLTKLVIDEGDVNLSEIQTPIHQFPLDRGSEPMVENVENNRSSLNSTHFNNNNTRNDIPMKHDIPEETDSFELEGIGHYTGQHIGYVPNGTGTLTTYDGTVLSCKFEDGKATGTGTQMFKDGSIYKGSFVHGMKHGKGVLRTSSHKYKGEWRDNMKEGKGIILYSNSESYEGGFLNDYPHGKGRYIFKDQSVYDGEFIKGKRHGHGILYYSDGVTVYEGNWDQDRKCGQAKVVLSNGIYQGSIVDDVKEGYGVYSYKNGDVYEGYWKQDKKHGEGIYFFANGGSFKGKWNYSKKHGRGIVSTSEGTNYEEIWSMDRLISKKRLPIFLNPNLL